LGEIILNIKIILLLCCLGLTSCSSNEPGKGEISNHIKKLLRDRYKLSSLDYKVHPGKDSGVGRISVSGKVRYTEDLFIDAGYLANKDILTKGFAKDDYKLENTFAKFKSQKIIKQVAEKNKKIQFKGDLNYREEVSNYVITGKLQYSDQGGVKRDYFGEGAIVFGSQEYDSFVDEMKKIRSDYLRVGEDIKSEFLTLINNPIFIYNLTKRGQKIHGATMHGLTGKKSLPLYKSERARLKVFNNVTCQGSTVYNAGGMFCERKTQSYTGKIIWRLNYIDRSKEWVAELRLSRDKNGGGNTYTEWIKRVSENVYKSKRFLVTPGNLKEVTEQKYDDNKTNTVSDVEAVNHSNQMTVEIQKELARLNIYNGAIDGIAGNETKDAVLAFQSRKGIRADGHLNEDLLGILKVTRNPEATTTYKDNEHKGTVLGDMAKNTGQAVGAGIDKSFNWLKRKLNK